jgi:hypothetical protein
VNGCLQASRAGNTAFTCAEQCDSIFYFVVFVFVVILESFPQERGGGAVVVFAYGAGLGEIEAFGRGFGGADDVGGEGFGAESAGVVAGELEAIEKSCGAFDIEVAAGESVDDDGERNLDGFAVFEGDEFDVLAGDEIAASRFGGAVFFVATVQAMVEVTPLSVIECGRVALQAVGLDVTAKSVGHGFLLGGYPRGISLEDL